MFEKNKRIKIMRNPSEVKHAGLPYKLLLYTHELHHDQKDLFTFYNKIKQKQDHIIIMNCTVNIKKDNLDVSSFSEDTGINKRLLAPGTFTNTFCLPELEFIEKHGKILRIHAINMYKTRKNEKILNEARKNMRCIICNKPLYPYSDLRPSHHHVDYIENIYIKVCNECHTRLHKGDLTNHRFGIKNIVWECWNCGEKQVGAPCSKCGAFVSPGKNGYLHNEQRVTKRRKERSRITKV